LATIGKVRRLVNPGRRKRKNPRKMSALQKMFFGSKRQRAAIKNRSRRKNVSRKLRRRNVSSIITVHPKRNPGRRKRYKARKRNRSKKVIIVNKGERMATRHRRRVNRSKRRRNVVYRRRIKRGVYQYSSNPGRRRRRRVARRNPGVRHYRRHRRNVSHRRHHRRNPGMLTGTAGRVLGVVGGVAVTKLLSGFLPAPLNSGVLSYIGIGAIAVLQGKLVGKFAKNGALGNDMMVGGLAYLAAKVLNDFFPSIGSYTGISGMRGMGLIGGSNFYVPQVNVNGSMGTFLVPGAVGGAIGASMANMSAAKAGMGVMRRTGRLM
jgi:hypothetical protein